MILQTPESCFRKMGFLDAFCRPAVLLAACLVACGGAPKPHPRDAADAADTGRVVPVRDASEQAILQQAGTLKAGQPRPIGGATVIAGATYASAVDGRTCRSLRITRKRSTEQRLACTEGQAWFFVPDVFGLAPNP